MQNGRHRGGCYNRRPLADGAEEEWRARDEANEVRGVANGEHNGAEDGSEARKRDRREDMTVATLKSPAATSEPVLLVEDKSELRAMLRNALERAGYTVEQAFVALNCAAIPGGLVENELFGHERGAYTGAGARKLGKMELAHRGTVFLDEIGELPINIQSK